MPEICPSCGSLACGQAEGDVCRHTRQLRGVFAPPTDKMIRMPSVRKSATRVEPRKAKGA